jgi:hypothetical protein
MFEEEIQLENESKSLSFKSPFLYIFLVVILIIGSAAYFIVKAKKDLSPDQAKTVTAAILKARGPAYVHFRVGAVKSSVDEKPRDPHYKLLEKLGFVKLANGKDNAVMVSLTPLGEDTFTKLPEFKKVAKPDGTQAFNVPLATRQLVAIKSVTMVTPNSARVEYEWKWNPNKVGESFDASSGIVQKFSQWDRATLINKYGVDFYKQTQTATVNLVRANGGWKISEE